MILRLGFALLALTLTMQAQDGMPAFTLADLPGWKLAGTESYKGKELYGYIDGGAELYNEYGFERVTVQRFTRDSDEIQAAVYRMATPDAAFGIWSLSHASIDITDTSTGWTHFANGQLLMARGRYYISITGRMKDKEDLRWLAAAGTALGRSVRERDARLPAIFSNALLRPVQRSVRLIRGPLGLQNGASEWSELFEGLAITSVYLAPIELGPETSTFLQIVFAKPEARTEFLKRINCPKALKPSSEWTRMAGQSRAIRLAKDGTLQIFKSGETSLDILLKLLDLE
jgi:hypothetical protein